MQIVHRLAECVTGANRLDLAGEAFRLTNARLFLQFKPTQVKKRMLNKVAGGVVTFGAVPAPIEIYGGPTGRQALNCNGSLATEPGKLALPSPPGDTVSSGLEGKSLGNVHRDEQRDEAI